MMGGRFFTFIFQVTIKSDYFTQETISTDSEFVFRDIPPSISLPNPEET